MLIIKLIIVEGFWFVI